MKNEGNLDHILLFHAFLEIKVSFHSILNSKFIQVQFLMNNVNNATTYVLLSKLNIFQKMRKSVDRFWLVFFQKRAFQLDKSNIFEHYINDVNKHKRNANQTLV